MGEDELFELDKWRILKKICKINHCQQFMNDFFAKIIVNSSYYLPSDNPKGTWVTLKLYLWFLI